MAVSDLDDYPWDAVAPLLARARTHPGGLVDLSIGSPVDETPDVVRQALAAAGLRLAESPGVVGAAVLDPNHREDLWWLALVGVTLLLCTELWITRRMAARA